MVVEHATAGPAEGFEPDPDVARLRAALDVSALVKVGYDPERQVFAPGADHPIFGFAECVVANCTTVAVHVNGLCGPCWRRWRGPRCRALTLDEFVAIPRLHVELGRKRQVLCRVCCVPGFERPAAGPHGLCLACAHSYYRSAVAVVDEWIAGGQHRPGRRTPRPPAQPRPTYGRCERCGRLAAHPRPLSCQPCRFRWREVGQLDWATYCREHPMPVTVDGRILALAGVTERLRLEFFLGVQDALGGELKFNAWGELTRVAARLTKMGVHSVLDVDRSPIRTPGAQMLLPRIQWSVEQVLVDPGEELARDVWRLGLVRRDGGRSRLDLTQITQPWLSEVFRDWARESLGTRNAHYLRATLCQIRRLSESLRTRPDAGMEMTAVGRADIENFLMRLAGQASAGAIQNSTHVDCVIMIRSVLRRARDRGLTAPGGRLEGLPDTFALYESDTPQKVERDPDDEIGRSLPNTVIKQLTSPTALARLAEQSDRNVADATELLIRTGRRPAEICHLREGCLQWDERVRADGTLDRRPVLVYKPEKTPKRSKRLPVHAREALIIKRAHERARARFPDVPVGKLPLFPRGTQNRSGTVPISAHRSRRLRSTRRRNRRAEQPDRRSAASQGRQPGRAAAAPGDGDQAARAQARRATRLRDPLRATGDHRRRARVQARPRTDRRAGTARGPARGPAAGARPDDRRAAHGSSPGDPEGSVRVTGWPAAPAEAAFHGPAGEFVLRTEPHSEAHPMALLAQFLVAFGTACGRGAHYTIEADDHYPNEFFVLVGPSGKGRKGSSWGHVRRALAEADPDFVCGCLASGLSSGEGLIAQVRDAVDDADADAPADKRRLVLEQEFAQVLKVLSREGNTLSPIVRMNGTQP